MTYPGFLFLRVFVPANAAFAHDARVFGIEGKERAENWRGVEARALQKHLLTKTGLPTSRGGVPPRQEHSLERTLGTCDSSLQCQSPCASRVAITRKNACCGDAYHARAGATLI